MSCFAVGIAALLTPLIWPVALSTWGPAPAALQPSYLPALEPSRGRLPFDPGPLEGLAGMQPDYVIIGDSMAGRVDPNRLTALSGALIAPVLQNATGSGYWYLVFKNYVVASQIRPKRVFVFFRDTNLTEPMFRLDGAYREHLDAVARDREDELNRVVGARTVGTWYRLHELAQRAYRTEQVRRWIEPALTAWPARAVAGRGHEDALLARVNEAFGLQHLRKMQQVDVDDEDVRTANFHGNVDSSVLPLFLSLAREHNLKLCFVRVLRRPTERQEPPPESAALTAYVADLREYLRANGVDYLDDRDDPALARLPYADGDHISRGATIPYTDRFWDKVKAFAP